MKIELYTRDGCTYCDQSKKFLKDRNISFTEYKIGVNITREQVLEKFPEAKTLPVVTIDEEWIGGRDELFKKVVSESAR